MTEQARGILALDAPLTMRSIHPDFSEMAFALQTLVARYAEGVDGGDVQAALFHLTGVDRWSDGAGSATVVFNALAADDS